MQNLQHETQKQDGSYEFIDNKVRIKNVNGVDSILFEDISSISFKEISLKSNKASLICTFTALLMIGYGFVTENIPLLYIAIVIVIIGLVLMVVLKTYFDNVIIKTRGGKFFIYSVEHGKGSEQMDAIEKKRKKQTL